MFDESSARGAVRSALLDIAVPPFDMSAIRGRIATHAGRKRETSTSVVFRRFAAASAIVTISVFSVAARAPAIVQSIESRLHAALVAAGVGPGSRLTFVPGKLKAAIKPTRVTLNEARRFAKFRLVPPAGLPPDVVKREIVAEPLLVWSVATHRWSIDGEQIAFIYRRADGRSFDLIADPFDPTSVPVPHYIYQIDQATKGAMLTKGRHENFVFLNGNQALHAVVSSAINRAEIMRIGEAMRATRFPKYDGRNPARSNIAKDVRSSLPRENP